MRRGRIPYSAAEMAWLEANYRMVISDYHRAFVEQFGRTDVELTHLNQLRKRKGWKVGRDGGRYKGRLRIYTKAEMDWLEANRLLPIADYHRQFVETFGREATAVALHGLRKRQGWKTGRTGQFEPGQAPMNKGLKCAPGRGGHHPNARRTQFKSGQLPHNTKYLGHERVSKDGYVEISVDEPNPHTGYERRYVLKHKYLWEKKNGPIPEGMCLKVLDGNRQNTDPANWKLIPREMLPHLGGRFGFDFDNADPDVKPAMLAVAELKHRAKKLKKRASER